MTPNPSLKRSGVQGLALLVTFGAIAKSDWPRAAMERVGGMRSWFDKLTTNGRLHRLNELLMLQFKPVVKGLELGLRRGLAAIDRHRRARTT